jgi:hypothetical protein
VVNSVPLLLKLLAAHLAGDFLLQSARIAAGKARPAVLAQHLGVHAVLLALVGLTEPPAAGLWPGLLLVLAAHGTIDAWTTRRQPRHLAHLALDQSLHLASLVAGATLARPGQTADGAGALLALVGSTNAWAMLAGATLAVPAGATVIGRWVRPFREALSDASRAQFEGLELAGRWIGMLERLVIFVAVLARVESLIGFVIAAKAVLRLPEARERWSRELAEYYLVGSLASLGWAMVLGLGVRSLIERIG